MENNTNKKITSKKDPELTQRTLELGKTLNKIEFLKKKKGKTQKEWTKMLMLGDKMDIQHLILKMEVEKLGLSKKLGLSSI